jgi:hypothetical protein
MTDDHSIRPSATITRLGDHRRRPKSVFFTRPELNQLLSLYSRQVARGEWRDYAIDQRDGAAFFAVFRHTQESPLFTIVKTAQGTGQGTGRHGDFTLMSGRQRVANGKAIGDIVLALQEKLRRRAVALDGERYR